VHGRTTSRKIAGKRIEPQRPFVLLLAMAARAMLFEERLHYLVEVGWRRRLCRLAASDGQEQSKRNKSKWGRSAHQGEGYQVNPMAAFPLERVMHQRRRLGGIAVVAAR